MSSISLDGGKGFVRLVDTMGNDNAVVQMARVSYGDGTKSVREDEQLIRYLMRHKHTSPFEGCVAKFHIRQPIFVTRQWVRHRTASMNEYSARYSKVPEDYLIFPKMRQQSATNKQGSVDAEITTDFPERLEKLSRESYDAYETALEAGVAREQARAVLPINYFTEFYWVMNLHNLLHFLKLRTDSHAQEEIRNYAEAVELLVKQWVPKSHAAWVEYSKGAVTISETLHSWVRSFLRGDAVAANNLREVLRSRSKGEYREAVVLMGYEDELPTL